MHGHGYRCGQVSGWVNAMTTTEIDNGETSACAARCMARERSGMGRARVALLLLPALSILIGNVSHSAMDSEPPTTQAGPLPIMHRVFEALSRLLPISFDETAFNDSARRGEIEQWLDVLASASEDLNEHGHKRDAGFRNLSRSLASDTSEIRYRFEIGRFDEARYFLIESTKNCIACHSRLPSTRDFPLADQFIEKVDMQEMSAHEQAQIFVATRQFERALTTWEVQFRDKSTPPVTFDISGSLLDYLAIALRVVQDPKRARVALEELVSRDDLPRYLSRHATTWIADLKRHETTATATPSIALGREYLGLRDRSGEIMFGREHLVSDLLASSILLRFIDSSKGSKAAVAEAFYLLGIAGIRSVDGYWLPQAEYHLEASIRSDSKGPHAQSAYALLEESLLLGYGGSSGLHMPVDIWTNLQELRRMVDGEGKAP